MHIAMFTDYYLPTLGGVQTSIKAQKEALELAGHTVTVFCPLTKPSTDPTIVRLPTSRKFSPGGYPFVWPPQKAIKTARDELIKLGDIDIVHTHSEMGATIAGLVAGKELGIPLVQTMHGRIDVYTKHLPAPVLMSHILEKLHSKHIQHLSIVKNDSSHYTKTALARRMWKIMVNQANFTNHVIVPSKHFADKLLKQGVTTPLSVLSNGLEDSVLQQLVRSKPRKLAKNQKLKILWCGRVSPEKRPIEFLKAVRFLKNVEVSMYGDGVDMAKVKRYIVRYHLEDRVTVYGGVPQKDILRAMASCHLFISTSYDFDNQPMVLLEAMAAGLPAMFCDPDMTEVVPAKGSTLTNSPDAQGIAESIEKLQDSPEQISHMSKAMLSSKKQAAQQSYTTQLLRIYATAIKQSASPQK